MRNNQSLRALLVPGKRTSIAAAALLLAATLASCGTSTPTGPARTLVVGAIISLTGTGNTFGPQQARAMELAVGQENAGGGVDGAKIKLIVDNDGSNPQTASAEMTELIDRQGALIVLGPTLSNDAVVADPVADAHHTPVLAISNTANGLVGKCSYPCSYIWRDSLGESVAIPDVIQTADSGTRHLTRVAVINTTPDVLGVSDAQVATAAFAAAGISEDSRFQIPATASNAVVASTVTQMVAGDPQAIFVGSSFAGEASQIILDARADGFTGLFIGGNLFNSAQFEQELGSAGAGAESGTPWVAANDFPDNSSFVSAYDNAFGIEPDSTAAQAYSGIAIVAQALGIAGVAHSTGSIPSLRAKLQAAMSGVALMTPLGPFRFTSDHDVSQIVWVAALNGNGGQNLVGFCNPQC